MFSDLSPKKLQQIAIDCGGTVAAATVGQLLTDPSFDLAGVAAALSTTPIQLIQAIARDEDSSFMTQNLVIT